ncbi:hypothetical protein BST81_21575 [Leptolyngbya sp. 'hensonii']|uniref:hypothetical protein n=1 Tax=Leptolyngbya sp. 'hensonii' TaxID=1922337 RepID=UPI00095029AA|nr:hypothetical protein [Leptolyngbya sp. 'hensonii']OLP16381.1 hypothetical protein BST81_21575 [Leptolyngbya sp. 'hensonii']
MPVKQSHYEELLATYSNHSSVVSLLKQYRPYLEMLPSMRRANESFISLPLPVAKIQNPQIQTGAFSSASRGDLTRLPCDFAILMCDPDWKVKTGVEIFVFIHRPQEDFSELLGRWRQTQIYLDRGYEWVMPFHYRHILSEEAEDARPLFVVFPETSERIIRGLRGACLPYIVHSVSPEIEDLELSQEQSEELESLDHWELPTDSGTPSSEM